jgi:hypothetical protein
MIRPMRFLPLLLLPLFVGCGSGDPCTWTVSNDTGLELETVRYAQSGSLTWSGDVLADVPLPPNEPVAFDVEGGFSYDLQGFGGQGQRYSRNDAITCENGESHETSLGGPDLDL